MKKVLFFVLLLSVVLQACAPGQPKTVVSNISLPYMVVVESEGFEGEVIYFQSPSDFKIEDGKVCSKGELIEFDLVTWYSQVPNGVLKHTRGEFWGETWSGRCYENLDTPWIVQLIEYVQ